MTVPSDPSLLYPGVNVVLMGPPGTSKTYCLHTLVKAGIETFVVFLEPGVESLLAPYADKGLPVPPTLHYHELNAKQRSFEELRKVADDVGKYDLKFLANYKDPKRAEYNRFEALYACLNDFVDQRGQHFGSVDSWDNTRAIVIDGTTGVGNAALDMMTGAKVVRDKPDFGIAQTNIANLVGKLTQGCRCHFVLIAHIDRYMDDVGGGMKLFPSLPGKALQSSFSQPFSDVILCKREGATWHWDTADSSADLKTRNLPIQSKLPADFGPLLATWRKRRDADVASRKA